MALARPPKPLLADLVCFDIPENPEIKFLLALPAFEPAFAKLASALVIWMMFALTVGAVAMTCINFFNSVASSPRLEAVCAVLFPALASTPNALANWIVLSDTMLAVDNELIRLLRLEPNNGSDVAVACALSPALARLDTALTTWIVFFSTFAELLNALARPFILFPRSVKLTFDRPLILEFASLVNELIKLVSDLLSNDVLLKADKPCVSGARVLDS